MGSARVARNFDRRTENDALEPVASGNIFKPSVAVCYNTDLPAGK